MDILKACLIFRYAVRDPLKKDRELGIGEVAEMIVVLDSLVDQTIRRGYKIYDIRSDEIRVRIVVLPA